MAGRPSRACAPKKGETLPWRNACFCRLIITAQSIKHQINSSIGIDRVKLHDPQIEDLIRHLDGKKLNGHFGVGLSEWMAANILLFGFNSKNNTVHKSTKYKTRIWMTDHSQQNTALNPGTRSCFRPSCPRDSLRRKSRTGFLLPWPKVNCMVPKVRSIPLVALLLLVLREKNIAWGKQGYCNWARQVANHG